MMSFLKQYCLEPLRTVFAPLIIVKIIVLGLWADAYAALPDYAQRWRTYARAFWRIMSTNTQSAWQRLTGAPQVHFIKPEFLTTIGFRRGLVCVLLLLCGVLNLGVFLDANLAPLFYMSGWCQAIIWHTVSGFGLASLYLWAMALIAMLALCCPFPNERARQRLGRLVLAQRMVFGFVSLAGAGLLAQVLKHLVGRARPSLVDKLGAFHFDVLSLKATLASFPSGHTVTAFGLVYFVFALTAQRKKPQIFWRSSQFYWRAGIIIIAILIALSRLMLGAHYVSDVLAGAILGLAVSFGLAYWFGYRCVCFSYQAGRIVPRGQKCLATTLAPLKHLPWL